MTLPSLPPAVAALADEPNVAGDAALVEVLPTMDPAGRSAALQMLVKRGHTPSLAAVVGRYHEYDAALQGLIANNAGPLFSGIRQAFAALGLSERSGAIEVVVRGGCGPMVFLLVDALRATCPRTKELAAEGLHRMTDRLLDHLETVPDAGGVSATPPLADDLAEALGQAVMLWELHLQPKVLEAALWMGDRVAPAICRKLQEPRTKIAPILNKMLAGTSDPRQAGFVLRALAMPALRASAASAISQAHDLNSIAAVLSHVWLLADSDIEQGCRWIRSCRWLSQGPDGILKLDGHLGIQALRLLAATGVSHERKIKLYRKLIDADREDLSRAVVWHLIEDDSEAATELLSMIAGRPDDGIRAIARRELRRRRPESWTKLAGTTQAEIAPPGSTTRQAFERYWHQFDQAATDQLTHWQEEMRSDMGALLTCIRARLAGSAPADRARALRVLGVLGLAKNLEEQVFLLAHDADPVVRSRAVALLADLPGPTGRRILRQAVNDRDERVVANAIETLDLLDAQDRIADTKPKLNSTNSRIRANAVKSLLRLDVGEAGEALLDMLEGPTRAHRLSALWVVERLKLKAVSHRLAALRSDSDARVRQRAGRIQRGLLAGSGSNREPGGHPHQRMKTEHAGGPP